MQNIVIPIRGLLCFAFLLSYILEKSGFLFTFIFLSSMMYPQITKALSLWILFIKKALVFKRFYPRLAREMYNSLENELLIYNLDIGNARNIPHGLAKMTKHEMCRKHILYQEIRHSKLSSLKKKVRR